MKELVKPLLSESSYKEVQEYCEINCDSPGCHVCNRVCSGPTTNLSTQEENEEILF
jgi:hypothetical protein